MSGYRPSLRPWPFEEPRLWPRPVGSERHTVLDGHPAKYAERLAVAEGLPEIFGVTISEALIGQRPDGAIGAPPIHAVAYRHEPQPVEGADGLGEERHILPQDLPAARLVQPWPVDDRLAVLVRHFEVGVSWLVLFEPADLLYGEMETLAGRTRRIVPVHAARQDQRSRVVVSRELAPGAEPEPAGGDGRPRRG